MSALKLSKARRAARLCKADLLTEAVGEFPELQGTMGKYYAEEQGEDEAVAHAIEDHYRPKGPGDLVPSEPVSVAVALADKIDTLVGFWGVGEKPTGSKDPYALRRAALGVVTIVLDNAIRFRVLRCVEYFGPRYARRQRRSAVAAAKRSVCLFLPDRLKVQLREKGARHDLVERYSHWRVRDDLLLIVRRVEALAKFLDTGDGKNLLAGYKRATNIIRIEEKKDGRPYTGAPVAKLYEQSEEKALAQAIDTAKAEAGRAAEEEDFEAAMHAMARLWPHVDTFFDSVTVNVDDGKGA